MEEEKKELMDKLKEQVETSLENISNEGIQVGNLDRLYKLIDIHKDIKNEEYWKVKEENSMRYSEYGRNQYGYNREPYGRRMRDSRGRYRGEEMLDEMNDHYRRYQEGKEMYGNDAESMKALQYMLDLDKEFIKMLMRDAKSPEEKEMIMGHVEEMGEM